MASFQLAANPILGREPGSKETRASWRKQAAKFYVLGYDDQQPLPWLKEMSTLRTEGIVQERAPLAHLAGDEEASELRQRLRDVRRAASKL